MPPFVLLTLWLLALARATVMRHINGSYPQLIENHQGKGQAKGSAGEATDKDALAHHPAVTLQSLGQVGIGNLLGFPQFPQQCFRTSVVKGAAFYVVCHVLNSLHPKGLTAPLMCRIRYMFKKSTV